MLAILVKVVHFIVCIGLIVIVLLQADKGEGLAGAFGGGASGTIFGERGGGGPMAKLTTGMAVVFMITSLLISVYLPATSTDKPSSLTSPIPVEAPTVPPVVPGLPLPMGGGAPAPQTPGGQ